MFEDSDNKKVTFDDIKKVVLFLKPFKLRIIIISFCALMLSGLNILQPLLRQRLIDNGILERNFNVVLLTSLFIFGLFLVSQLLETVQFIHYTYINKLLPFRLFQRAFRHLLRLPVAFFKDSNSAKIIWSLEYDAANIARISDSVFIISLVQSLSMVGGLIGLTIINWKLSLLVILIIPVKILVNNHFSKRRVVAHKKNMKIYTRSSEWMGESVQGITAIKLWNKYSTKLRELIGLKRDAIRNEYKLARIDHANNVISMTIDYILDGAFYILGAIMIFDDQLTLGGLFTFISYSALVIGSITFITRIKSHFDPIIPSMQRYTDFMELEEEKSGKLDVPDNEPKLAFKNVSLSYDNKTNAVENISFEVNTGEKIAIVGANGSGKSSLVHLIMRSYECTTGKITLNDINIKDLKLDKYRELFSNVEQSLFLFNATVRDNITFGNPIVDEHIRTGAKLLGIEELLDKLPDGLDTDIGVDGSKLSGGERQKVAALRAWMKPHKILILDEVTNNLDAGTEYAVNNLITKTKSDKIIIVITHRTEILKKMDKILVMDEGKLVGAGTHDDLLKTCSSYNPEFDTSH